MTARKRCPDVQRVYGFKWQWIRVHLKGYLTVSTLQSYWDERSETIEHRVVQTHSNVAQILCFNGLKTKHILNALFNSKTLPNPRIRIYNVFFFFPGWSPCQMRRAKSFKFVQRFSWETENTAGHWPITVLVFVCRRGVRSRNRQSLLEKKKWQKIEINPARHFVGGWGPDVSSLFFN